MSFDPSTWSWTCMVCGDTRPDEYIAVAKHPVENRGEPIPGATYNMRHCTDRPACVDAAKNHGPLKIGEHRPDRRFMPVFTVDTPDEDPAE